LRFTRREPRLGVLAAGIGKALPDLVLIRLYIFGFVGMAGFVTVYNYLGFRLVAEPFGLSPAVAGLLFTAYIAGSIASATTGRLVDRYGRARVLWPTITLILVGLALVAFGWLPIIAVGLVIFTAAFFTANSIATGWAGRRSTEIGAQGAAVYMFGYYMGGAVGGVLGGVVFADHGWGGLTAYCAVLVSVALASAVSLAVQFSGTNRSQIAPSGGSLTVADAG
jgi:YNFM family putative membrane transporter